MAQNCTNSSSFDDIFSCDSGVARESEGITTRAFALNLAVGAALFVFNVTGFFLLKSSAIGRRIYQPKTYLVQSRLRVEAVPASPIKWIRGIFAISGEQLKLKCGLDGYFFIRFIRAMIIVFAPLMVIVVTILLPVNYNGGKGNRVFDVGGHPVNYSITGLDTLSWQNVAPTQTDRYWAHLVCAIIAITWTLYRIYREKLHYIDVRQQFLLSPEHRLKASARTVLITNIPSEYQSDEALKAFFDIFVDNDDRSRLHVWVNRDYGPLKAAVLRRRKLRHALEKTELKLLRLANRQRQKDGDGEPSIDRHTSIYPDRTLAGEGMKESTRHAFRNIQSAFEADYEEGDAQWPQGVKAAKSPRVTIFEDDAGNWNSVSLFRRKRGDQRRSVPKSTWLRYEIARCTVEIEEMLQRLNDEHLFSRQNSAFVQFDRQMSANMACSLVSHHLPGRMTPRFLDVAPHEILWPNMGLTSKFTRAVPSKDLTTTLAIHLNLVGAQVNIWVGFSRFVRTWIAFFLFLGMLFLWAIPATFLGLLSQLSTLRVTTKWLSFLRPWPEWIISLISGPLSAILLALLVQLVVPALCRKLAVLVGAPTRSRREVITQAFYFTFLLIELVLVTSISSSIVATIPTVLESPQTVATLLATDLPKGANYFFNYLIIQGLGFSGSVLFQYLRVLYITICWPFFTQTPRQEAWLQTTIPHQMWGNVYPLITNFAAIGLIYSIIAPLMLIFISATFSLLWIAYRHNYYYVQRVKVDTHGMLFCQALSQLFAGIYILEIALIGLFFLVRNPENHFACTAQGVIMIVVLALTAAYHYVLEHKLQPLYELLPVSLEDSAADAEKLRFSTDGPTADGGNGNSARPSMDLQMTPKVSTEQPNNAEDLERSSSKQKNGHSSSIRAVDNAGTAANARRTLMRLRTRVATRLASNEDYAPGRSAAATKLGVAIATFPDELSELSKQERDAELRVAYQDPVTREPAPVIWVPQDPAAISEQMIKRAEKYGRFVQYSNAGAYLTNKNKCEITQPAPDVRSDWLLDWVL